MQCPLQYTLPCILVSSSHSLLYLLQKMSSLLKFDYPLCSVDISGDGSSVAVGLDNGELVFCRKKKDLQIVNKKRERNSSLTCLRYGNVLQRGNYSYLPPPPPPPQVVCYSHFPLGFSVVLCGAKTLTLVKTIHTTALYGRPVLHCMGEQYCTACEASTALHARPVLPCMRGQYCTVWESSTALYGRAVLHCMRGQYCTVWESSTALYGRPVLHCMGGQYCTVWESSTALYGRPVQCVFGLVDHMFLEVVSDKLDGG